jgi:hypothetical protein
LADGCPVVAGLVFGDGATEVAFAAEVGIFGFDAADGDGLDAGVDETGVPDALKTFPHEHFTDRPA